MRRATLGLLVAVATTVAACGVDTGLPEQNDDPLVQIRSEGGFAPVEFVLGRGPTFTLLANGRLIHEGPVAAVYPGPLLPNYQVTTIGEEQIREVLALVEEMGLPGIEDERDDSANQFVADATTEVVTYWDENGTHRYSVYALGIEPDPEEERNRVFLELIELLGELTASAPSEPFDGERVQIIAGIGFADPEITDVRDWPLEDGDFSEWLVLPNQWMCKMYGSEVLEAFEDATQATEWTQPDPMMDADSFKLLVRPLHPGEPDCLEGL